MIYPASLKGYSISHLLPALGLYFGYPDYGKVGQ